MEPTICLFDLDDTLCAYTRAQKGMNKRDLVKEMETIEWWANMPRYQLGFDIWELAGQLGMKRMILTKGPRRIPNAWTGKKMWVDANLGMDTGLTITHDKGLFYGRILVDDWPEYAKAWLKHRPRGLVIMPASPVNEKFSHPQVIRYDGTNLNQVRTAMMVALKRDNAAKVGILGGSFDPPHLGHLALAEAVLESKLVDEVWFMPCLKHRFGKSMAHHFARLKMCELMLEGNPTIKVSDYEITKGLPGSTLTMFQNLEKEPYSRGIIDYSCVIGLDNANDIGRWKNSDDLLSSVKFIVVRRPGSRKAHDDWYTTPPHAYVEAKTPNISSTKIRVILKAWWDLDKRGQSPAKLLHPDVFQYIEKHGLYKVLTK